MTTVIRMTLYSKRKFVLKIATVESNKKEQILFLIVTFYEQKRRYTEWWKKQNYFNVDQRIYFC